MAICNGLSADVGCERPLTPAEDFQAALEQQGRNRHLTICRAAIRYAQRMAGNAHKRHGLNLCDVISYLEAARDALESEVEQ